MAGGFNTVVAGTVITASAHNQYVRNQVISRFASATARDSAIGSSAEEGMYADLADDDILTRYNGTAWDLRPFPIIARKTADELIASSTTLQNDDNLAWAVTASAVYLMELRVQYKADAAGDLKWGFTFPSGLTMLYGYWGVYDSASAFTSNGQKIQTDVPVVGGVGASTGIMLAMSGIVTVAATAGTLQFQWAQNTSNVNSTTVCAGSYGTLTRVA